MIANVYAKLIQMGAKTLEDVPETIRGEVAALLEKVPKDA